MNKKVKKIFSLLLALTIVINLFSAAIIPAAAAGDASGRIILEKFAKLEDDGTYTIDLSGFVTGQSSTSQVTNAVPLDVVLVLDASSSMLKFNNTPDTYSSFTAPEGWNTSGGTEIKRYPANATSSTNLWHSDTGMSRTNKYYNASGEWEATSSKTAVRGSVMIPVKPGDKIYCSSFESTTVTGGDENGIMVTFFRSSGTKLKSLTAAAVYQEYRNSDTVNDYHYITVPESAYSMNIPVWTADGKTLERKVIYNLSLGEERYNPVSKVEFGAIRAKVLQAQIDKFADSLVENALATGVTHKLGIVTFGGGTTAGTSGQGRYEKHVGVNGYNDYLFTNTGMFVNGEFKNWMDSNKVDNKSYPHYTPVFSADLNKANTYYYLDHESGTFKAVTFDSANNYWANETGVGVNPKATPYDYNSRVQFYTMKMVANEKTLKASDYRAALPSVLGSDNKINPVVQAAVDRYVARGTTHTKYGLAMADEMLQNNSNITKDENGNVIREAQRVVILFTDGETNDPGDNYKTIFWRANSIKGQGAKLYTVSLTDAEDGSSNVKLWMDQISSNVPFKEGYSNLDNCSTMFDANAGLTGGKYYMDIADASELDEIFTSITTDVTTSSTTVELGDDAVMQDYLAAGFKLPADFDFSNITVSTVGLTTDDDVNYTEIANTQVVFNRPDNAGNVNEATGNFHYTYTQNGVTATKTMEVKFNKDTGMVSVKGFHYSENYVAKEHDGRKLSVRITGVEATDAVSADVLLNTNHTSLSGIAYTTATESGVHPFPAPKTQFAEVTYVMDYAKPMTVNSADWGGTIIGVAGKDRLKIDGSGSECSAVYGAVMKHEPAADGSVTVTFTPTEMKWGEAATFYVLRTLLAVPDSEEDFDGGVDYVPEGVTTGTNQWLRVNVVPANNIYFEDDFGDIVYDGNWQSVGAPQNDPEHPEGATGDADGIHGWEESLLDNKEHSDSDAHMGEVTETVGGVQGKIAEVTFPFVGKGVDVYSFTNDGTGTILATLSGTYLEDGKTKTVFKAQIVDTQSVSGDYYQIPTLSFMDLPYGTYTVTIRVTTAAEDRFVYYLDGIRVYNPMADDSAYSSEERNAVFEEIRDLLAANDAGNQGAVFIDKLGDEVGNVKDYDQTEYGLYGPKNEVYLAKNQSITFKVGTEGANYYIGLKCPAGNGSAVAKISNGADTVRQIDITHSTDLYYKVVPKDGYITVENVGNGLLSVTKLRITGENGQVQPITEEGARMALRSFRMMPVVRDQEPSCEHSYVGNLCTNCGDRLNDVVFQGNAEGTALRMLTYVGDLADYSMVSFRVTIGGKTTELECTKAYTSVAANGTQKAAADVFGEDAAYFVMFTLTGVTEAMYETEITVSVIWTDINGNKTEGEARTVAIGDLF